MRLCAIAIALLCACSASTRADAVAPGDDVVRPEQPRVMHGGDPPDPLARYIAEHYDKREVRIPMRDGARLFTAIYTPKDIGTRPRPIMLVRTPYGLSPYGAQMPDKLGPSEILTRKGWIFVLQDVRGRFMSEGTFVDMTPHRPEKSSKRDIDESTDTYDTIAWLLDNVAGHNGRVGQWGISYPGFYAAAGMIDAHPALAAVSPQAPIADWFFDDFHHHGAFFLPHAFNFFASFGIKQRSPYQEWPERFDHGTPDGYRFFLDLGPLHNANDRYFHGEIAFWNELVAHPDYDEFWQARNLLPHLHDVAPAVMTVGGWFDAEDLYGPLHVYREIEKNDPDAFNVLVMGPWSHGGWARTTGRRLGPLDFGADTSTFYQRVVEAPFFEHYLDGGPPPGLPEAYAFETGANRWRRFEQWPPGERTAHVLYAATDGRLTADRPRDKATATTGFDAYVSDPQRPVPFTEEITTKMPKSYMTADQRFVSRRPDVVTYQTDPLEAPVTMAGPLTADLWVSTSGTAADFVVKVIDVFPPDATMPDEQGEAQPIGDAQIMIRGEVIRARFRDDYVVPKPMVADAPTRIRLTLQDVLHTFGAGHRIMVQIHSTWFPMVDRNPQTYVPNIFEAKASDFVVATHRVWRSATRPTALRYQSIP